MPRSLRITVFQTIWVDVADDDEMAAHDKAVEVARASNEWLTETIDRSEECDPQGRACKP